MISQLSDAFSELLKDLNGKLPSACASAECLSEVVRAIRDIPEHKRVVVSVRNSDSARDMLVRLSKSWLETRDTLSNMAWVQVDDDLDYPIAASIIALADSGRDEDAIFVSSKVAADRSMEIASGIADSLLLQKALE